MTEYQINCLDENNRVVLRKDYLLPDDATAVERAKELCKDFVVEVWRHSKLVTKFSKTGDPIGRFPLHNWLSRR